MKTTADSQKYVALLRGVNVGGQHKVSMAGLKDAFETMGFNNVKTLLNSGNVVFEGSKGSVASLQEKIASQLGKTFGFPIPALVRSSEELGGIVAYGPFNHIRVTGDTRLYVTFIPEDHRIDDLLPWTSADGSFQILAARDKAVFSVLDLSLSKTTDAMRLLEKRFGKDITTRNWNTVVKIYNLMNEKD